MCLSIEDKVGKIDTDHVFRRELLLELGVGVKLPLLHESTDDLDGVVLKYQEWGYGIRCRTIADPGVGGEIATAPVTAHLHGFVYIDDHLGAAAAAFQGDHVLLGQILRRVGHHGAL